MTKIDENNNREAVTLEFSKKHQERTDLHWPRRIFHASSGIILVFLSFVFTEKFDFLNLLAGLIILELILELVRLRNPEFQKWAEKLFGSIMRAGEESRLSGVPYYGVGCFISFLFFPKEVAVLAVLYLALGDPVASVAGRLAKKRWFQGPERRLVSRFSEKSLEGSLFCFIVCAGVTAFVFLVLFPEKNLSLSVLFLTSLVGGLCAALAEILPLRTDDNLSIPLVSGALFWVYASAVHILPGF